MPLRASFWKNPRADAGVRDVGIAVLLIQLEASGGPDGGGRGPRTRRRPRLVRRGYSDCIDGFRRDNRPPD